VLLESVTSTGAARGIDLGTTSGLAGTGNGFTVSGLTTINDATGDGIAIGNSSLNANFTGLVTIVNDVGSATVADGVDLGTGAGGANTGTYSFNGGVNLTVNGTNAFGLRAQNSGTVNITDVGTTQITSQNGTALLINPTTLNATLDSITSGGGTNGVSLTGMTGTLTINGGSITGATGAAFNVDGGTANVTYAGGITQANNAALVNVQGAHTGTLTFNTGTLTATNGTGLQFNNADGTYIFNGTNTLSNTVGGATADAGIDVVNGSNGNFTFSSNTSISNPNTGADININGGTGNFTYNGTITDDVGQLVAVANKTAGTTTFGGTITDGNDGDGNGITVSGNTGGTVNFNGQTTLSTGANTAVNLSSNTGATINFNAGGNGLDITTGTGVGFNATGGGTVNVTGANNSINSVSATALNVANTTIGASGLTFHDISAGNNTAAADPVSGVVLNNTGTSGGLHGTGNNTTARDGSGGTIQNTTGNGISLTSTQGVQLAHMNINNTGNNGVFGSAVNGFVSDWNSFSSNGNAVNEGGIRFGGTLDSDPTGLTGGAIGTATETRIDHTVITGSFEHGLVVENTSGTLTQLNLTSTTIQNDANGSGFLIETRGTSGSTAAATVQIAGSSFLNNPGAGVAGNALRNTALTINILGNTAAGTNTFTGHDTILLGNGDTGHLVAARHRHQA
jgi:hypothetical protein